MRGPIAAGGKAKKHGTNGIPGAEKRPGPRKIGEHMIMVTDGRGWMIMTTPEKGPGSRELGLPKEQVPAQRLKRRRKPPTRTVNG